MHSKVIFDTDPGIDDTMAMLFLEKSPAIDIVGITTVFGNASINDSTRNALYIKERFNIHALVAKGASKPLEIEYEGAATIVHGDNGLGNIELPRTINTTADPRPAYQYIIDTVQASPNEITLVAVGPLTNLALALQHEPTITNLVKEVVIMGGAFGYNRHKGNITPFAEANIFDDPHAADIVVSAPWNVTMLGLDVTKQTIMTPQYLDILKQQGGEMGAIIYDISRFYLNFYKKSDNIDGFYAHDASAAAYVIEPNLFQVKQGKIRVVTEGIAMGHTMIKEDEKVYLYDEFAHNPTQKICIDVNNTGFLKLYFDTITGST